jgi:hypothetical protein
MNNVDKGIALVKKANLDKANYFKYAKALERLADREREEGRGKEADFIEQGLGEALATITA